jgi:predicted nucleotidyltransferase
MNISNFMTVSKTKKNIKLKVDTELINKLILQNVNNSIISIILYGSYGRGEGAFFINEQKVCVYNDYDILLIVKKIMPTADLLKIKKILLKNLDIRWIDISQKTIPKLKKLKPIIFNFDLKYGSRVIWGDKNVFEHIPNFTSKQLTLWDAETLYFTRLFTFFGSLNPNYNDQEITGEDSRFFRNQMAKGVLAIVDVLLLQKKQYHSSYQERVSRLKLLYPKEENLILLSNWALKEKLSTTAPIMNKEEIETLIFKVSNRYIKEMYIVLSKFYGKEISTTDDLRKAKFYSLKELIVVLKVFIKSRSLKQYYLQQNILFAQSYYVESITVENQHKKNCLNKCLSIINRIRPELNLEKISQNRLREIIIELSRI